MPARWSHRRARVHRAPMSFSQAPAFIHTAPPTVPGMPAAKLRPAKPQSAAITQSFARLEPLWARMVGPSRWIALRFSAILMTTPRMPPSRTRMLVPLPMTRGAWPRAYKPAGALWSACGLRGTANTSAGTTDPEGGVAGHGLVRWTSTPDGRLGR